MERQLDTFSMLDLPLITDLCRAESRRSQILSFQPKIFLNGPRNHDGKLSADELRAWQGARKTKDSIWTHREMRMLQCLLY